jgi:ubiquinone/menaquinone biosynthesis C-methylase UbiE
LTSQNLVDLAALAADATVIDLACGTGVTTRAVLARLGQRGRVIAVDASATMLASARAQVTDGRVTWLRAPAEHLGEHPLDDVDAVVCNSAFWQTDMQATTAAVRKVLRPGGRFVFNLSAAMLADHADADESDPLRELMKDIAAREYGWAAAPSASAGRLPGHLSERWLRNLLARAGFRVEHVQPFLHQCRLREQRAWLSIPIFTLGQFGGLSYEQRMSALGQAYDCLAGTHPEPVVTTRWVAFAAAAS